MMKRAASRRSSSPGSRLYYEEQTDESSDDDAVAAVSSRKRNSSSLESKHERKVPEEADKNSLNEVKTKKSKPGNKEVVNQKEKSGGSSKRDNKNERIKDDSAKENDNSLSPQKKAPLSEFEAKRLKNIEERQNIFKQLNMGNLRAEMEQQLKDKRAALAEKRKLLKSTSPREPVRRSDRLVGRYIPKQPKIRHLGKSQKAPSKAMLDISTKNYSGGWKSQRRNWESVISLDKTLVKSFIGHEKSKLLLTDCCLRMCLGLDDDQGVLEPDRCSLEELRNTLENLTLKEHHKIKVVPNRIHSLAMNPLTDGGFLVAAGCKTGAVGLWNCNAENTQNNESKLVVFKYHSRPANCITFGLNEPHLMYTTSYDGTIRRVDLQKQDASLIYQTPANRRGICWHAEMEPRVLLLGVGDGKVAILDTRLDNDTSITTFRCHETSLETISVHPGTRQHFATTSDDEVAIWDVRKVSEQTIDCKVSSIDFNKPLSSAFFSPITGNSILTTCFDNKIGVYDCTNLEQPTLVHKVAHNNNTGEWITNFRATWHPRREDVFVIGSMDDRKVEVFKFNPKIELMTELMDKQHMKTIGAVSVFHPYLPVVAVGNASGYVQVFM